jgi:hypothetical protein
LFQNSGVTVVFNGHEHNFQYTGKGQLSGDVLYVITGAGGELRDRSITPKLSAAGIAAAANVRHFTVVEIEGKTMRITPVGEKPFELIGPDGKPRPLPVVVNAR